MRIYLAAPWKHRLAAAAVAEQITALGHVITHDWWNHEVGSGEGQGGGEEQDHQSLARFAYKDVQAVVSANTFILLNLCKSEGKAVETGIAITLEKRLMGVRPAGEYTNIFQHLPQWEWFQSVEILLANL